MVWTCGKNGWVPYRTARRVLMEEVSGGPVRGRPRLGWMDCVKVALGNSSWDKLLKGRNYWNSRRRCQIYGLRGVCLMIVYVLSDLIWQPLLGGGRKSWYIIILFSLIALPNHNEDDPKRTKRASFIQYGYRKSGTHASCVYTNTRAWNIKTESR